MSLVRPRVGASARLVLLLALALSASALPASAARAAAPSTTLVSLSSTGVKSNGFSGQPSVTPDGRYVVFVGEPTNFVSPPLPAPVSYVYLRDRARGTTTPVARDSGNPFAKISDDGRWVAFTANLASLPENNSAGQVYLWDRESGALRRLSTNVGAGQAYTGIDELDISGDGSRVVYSAHVDAGRDDSFLVQLPSGTVRRLAEPAPGVPANGTVTHVRISGDGHWATYLTAATNLVVGDTNGVADVYRENLDSGAKQRVSVTADGGQASGGSSFSTPDRDGCVVAFASTATNLAPGATTAGNRTFVRDACQGTTEVASVGNDGTAGVTTGVPQISGDGCTVGFYTTSPIISPAPSGRALGVRDRCAGVTSRVDISTAGEPGDGVVGPGGFSLAGEQGRYVAFASAATNLAPGDGDSVQDTFLRDRANNVGPRIAVTIAQAGNRVSVDLSGSQDPDGFQLSGATSFGDGSAEVPGLVVSHEYPRAGTYTIALTVTDADGAGSRDYRTVSVAEPPADPGSDGGAVTPGGAATGAGRAGAGRLRLTAKLSRTRFAVAPRHGKPGPGQGTTLTATLSAAAKLTLTFERRRDGHRRQGKCRPGRGQGPRCALYERVGSLARAAGAGATQIALSGRLRSRALPPGTYRLLVAAGSVKSSLAFTVIKAARG